MDISIIMLPIIQVIVMCGLVVSGARAFDISVEYNNSQDSFIKLPVWFKNIFKIKSAQLPKSIYYRYYSVLLFALMLPTSLAIYFITESERLVLIVAVAQATTYIIDAIIVHHVVYAKYKKSVKAWKIEQEKDRELKTVDGGMS